MLQSQIQLLDFGFFEDNVFANHWVKLFEFKLVLTLFLGRGVVVAGFSGGNELDDVACSRAGHGNPLENNENRGQVLPPPAFPRQGQDSLEGLPYPNA